MNDGPTSLTDAVRHSGLIEPAELDAYLVGLPPAVLRRPRELADRMVSDGRLTAYQASKLLKGQWQGLTLKSYHVLSPIARGGMGTVYLARDRRKNRLVALKVLPERQAMKSAGLRQRFLREMELCRRVQHPHLTQTFDAGTTQGVYYIAMEYIRGRTLREYIEGEGTFWVERAARFASEVARGLNHAHQVGLIHRDLKPSNIMITPNLHAKVVDLGLALVEGEEWADEVAAEGKRVVLGTMDYIAPEQTVDSSRVDARADLYALGCVVYFSLTGQPPFPGGDTKEKMRKHREARPEPIARLNPTVPDDFAVVVERLMAKKPEDRFASARELREVLKPWAAGDPALPLDLSDTRRDQELLDEVEAGRSKDLGAWDDLSPVAYASGAEQSGGSPVYRTEDDSYHALFAVGAFILALAAAAGLILLVR